MSNFKKMVRARMEKTGESWQTAQRFVRAQGKKKRLERTPKAKVEFMETTLPVVEKEFPPLSDLMEEEANRVDNEFKERLGRRIKRNYLKVGTDHLTGEDIYRVEVPLPMVGGPPPEGAQRSVHYDGWVKVVEMTRSELEKHLDAPLPGDIADYYFPKIEKF